MKRVYITTVLTCLVILAVFIGGYRLLNIAGEKDHLTVGFIYDNDESTPYTYNFSLAKDELEKKYGERVTILTCSNVMDDEMEEPLRDLAEKGCDVIFFNGYSELVMTLAPQYPDVQFCQTSYMDLSGQTVPENYHAFKGEAYQGRYVSGIAAGMKIKQMIEDGIITEEEAVAGFVAAFPNSEVISGYTAFLMGVRSIVPTAVMRVKYTETWSSYALEKSAAQQLINDGCVIISQYTDTIGPAIACEEASQEKEVYYVGFNQSMSEVAPGTSLVTARICWEEYILAAVKAVMSNKKIESVVSGHVEGNDAFAGFEEGWVEMVDLNLQVAAFGTQQAMDRAIDQFKRGSVEFVFKGNYVGVNPEDPADTIDLSKGYVENEKSSYPLFHYVLKDVITIVDAETSGEEAGGTQAGSEGSSAKDGEEEKKAEAVEYDVLKDACKDYFMLGVGINGSTLDNLTTYDKEYMALVKKHFNSVTLSNLMKSCYILQQKESQESPDGMPVLDFTSIDDTLQWCMDNGVKMRGHTLVWHTQAPGWFFRKDYKDNGAYVDKETMLARMESYIKQMLEHVQENYPGVIYCWDVVNEAVDPDKGDKDSFFLCRTELDGEPNPWYVTIGPEYVEAAFRFARKYADEDVKLFYNDYNTFELKKRSAIYALCEDLKAKGLIDGIGMQGYWGIDYPNITAITGTITLYAKLELEIQITELSVGVDEETPEEFEKQAKRYRNIFLNLKSLDTQGGGSANITSVTFFGLKDHYVEGDKTNARLFDKDCNPKPAFDAVLQIFNMLYN